MKKNEVLTHVIICTNFKHVSSERCICICRAVREQANYISQLWKMTHVKQQYCPVEVSCQEHSAGAWDWAQPGLCGPGQDPDHH
jgi:hypothetical protein